MNSVDDFWPVVFVAYRAQDAVTIAEIHSGTGDQTIYFELVTNAICFRAFIDVRFEHANLGWCWRLGSGRFWEGDGFFSKQIHRSRDCRDARKALGYKPDKGKASK